MSADGIAISFKPQISAFAKAHHLDLTPEAADSLDATLQSLMKVDGASVAFPVGSGRTGTIDDALALYSEGTPRKATSSAPIRVTTGSTATARALAQNAARRSPARIAQAKELADAHGNPWHPRSINRSRQAAISNLDPTLATQLKSAAGAQP